MIIEDRAKDFIKTYATNDSAMDKVLTLTYIYGAIEQRNIDTEKAYNVLMEILRENYINMSMIKEAIFMDRIKQAMNKD